MTEKYNRWRLIIVYAILLHFTWAISLSIDPAAGYATAVHTLLNFVPDASAIGIYSGVAALATIGMFCRKSFLKAVCMLPQQFIMMVSAGGAIWSMWLGQFADGVQRPHAFLIADQAPAVIAAMLHTYAIIMIAQTKDDKGLG
jgi:hypothetical protein